MFLFHVTNRRLSRSIEQLGLLPGYAGGSAKCVWLCDEDRVEWAAQHVMQRHGWTCDELSLIPLMIARERLRATCWAGVYQCYSVIGQVEMIAGLRIFARR